MARIGRDLRISNSLPFVPIRVHSWFRIFAVSCFAITTATACTIPVFRFALDRWEADPFRLVVPRAWATDREKVKLLVPLRGNAEANVVVEESDDAALDRAVLKYPHDDTVLWEGALDETALAPLLDSPARRELIRRIVSGDSAVWVVATKEADRGEVERVAGRLKFLEQVASLPVQNPSDPDSQLGPGPELKLAFSVLPLSLDDPVERSFAMMLAGPGHPEFVKEGTSFAAPVFGRGRVLGAWALDELDDAMIEDTSLFLTGRCSCRVKNENPGWDLLLKVDWESALSAGPAETAAPIPQPTPAETVVISPAAEPPGEKPKGISVAALGGLALALAFAIAGWRLWRLR